FNGTKQVSGSGSSGEIYNFSTDEMYLLGIEVELAAGQTMRITARDRQGRALPGKQATLTASGRVIFRSPFMAGLTLEGTGIVRLVVGVTTRSVLEADDWQLTQVVGLPFPKGQTTAYNPEAQGFADALTFPDQAALIRLLMGAYIMPAPPDLGDPSLSTPAWLPPDPLRYIDYLTRDSSSLLFDIQKCLENTDDSSWNPAARQPAFVAQRTISGIHQDGIAPATSGSARFPVVGSALLQVSSDSFGALALGYGTYDFANQTSETSTAAVASAVALRRGYDYKVEAPFILRPNFEFPFPELFGSFSEKQLFVALSEDLPLPAPPAGLSAPSLRVNRPVVLDGPASEAVKVSWRKPELPESWGLVSSHMPGQSAWLNTENFFSEKSYQPYLTREPQGEETGADTDRFHFVDPEVELPLFGTKTTRYFLAGIDVFGRWSAFRQIPHTGQAIAPQRPVIHSVKLALPNPDGPFPPPTPATVNVNLEVEFSWDWTDRRAAQIQLAGQFFTAKTTPPAAPPAGFSIHSNNAPHPLVTITFDLDGNPVSTDLGTVTRLMKEVAPAVPGDPPPPPVPSNQYRLVVENLTAVFPSGDPHAVAYAVYIRALERVRVPALEFSPWPPIRISPPGITPEVFLPTASAEMPDPRLPAVVHVPAEVQFTAFPDATKIARGRLDWPGAANALGYIVWEASETAIRAALDARLNAQFPGDPSRHLLDLSAATLVERATQLRDLLLQDEYAQLCAKAFARYSKDLITASEVELELTGSSDGLTVFRISSVNRSNLESEKSAPVFFAVPRLNRPLAPNLTVKPNGAGIDVQVQGNSPGAQAAGYRVYRVRKTPVSSEAGAKGRPVFLETDAAWALAPQVVLSETRLSGRLLDPIAERSWKPLYYQVTAIGSSDAARGVYSGESAGSPTRETYFPPENPPLLELTASPPVLPTLSLRTDIPFHAVRLGPASIELFSMEIDPVAGARKTLLKKWTAAEVQTEAAVTPRIENRLTDPTTGQTAFDLILDVSTTSGMVRVTDPLGRSTTLLF
ncbi:MAG: hypothetical protein JNK89_05650, partial [Saprospiraceae bacterium]|nr:hypothetical protein [Saprospiraceae bacterium]